MSTKSLIKEVQRDVRAIMNDGDYYGEDGLIYCGKCHTPKECRVDQWEPRIQQNGTINPLYGCEKRYTIHPTWCACTEEKYAKGEMSAQMSLRYHEKQARIAACYDVKELSKITFKQDDAQDTFTDGDGNVYGISSTCRQFVEKFQTVRELGNGMLFYGSTGGGKTFMAACVANALLDMNYRVRFTTIASLSAAMNENYRRYRNKILSDLAKFDLVVIDDFGRGQNTRLVNDDANEIIDTLYSSKTPMIITTNLDIGYILSSQDQDNMRIYDRIIERCYPIEFTNTDRRREGNTEFCFVGEG